MIAQPSSPLRIVLYEGPGAGTLADERRFETVAALLEAGYSLTRPAAGGSVSPADAAALLVLAELDGAPLPAIDAGAAASLEIRDISGLSPDQIVDQATEIRRSADLPEPGQWKPWFPVIDYKRCTNCMQCLTFCLFDVYGVDEGQQIQVQNQDNCKTNCPACSRVCPEVAIVFPKYKKGPINGAVVRQEDVESESMKVDISALLGGDIYAALRSRQDTARKRFSTERDESRALLERKRCLKKLKADLDIPDEVLMSLPSAGDIEERARRAREKMEKRMQRSRTVQDRRPAPTEEEWGI